MNRTRILFEAVVGSRAYGTHHARSDTDLKGIFVEPRDTLLSLTPPPEQVGDPKGDKVYYSLRRFLELALNANPNIIELLFMPTDCVRTVDPVFQPVLDHRRAFVTKQAYNSHVRYAQAQIKKATGQNKWINNPQPETVPTREDFCWFVPAQTPVGAMPLRPQAISQSGIDLRECHVASLEHTPNMYRLYHYGTEAKGVFSGHQLHCQPIPIEDEATHCIGLLIFNEQAYDRARRDHRNYWTWRKERNAARWETQENGQIDYDAKNMMHMFRLMLSTEHILKEGQPLVRIEGDSLAFLKSILAGEHSHAELLTRAETLLHSTPTLCLSMDPRIHEHAAHLFSRHARSGTRPRGDRRLDTRTDCLQDRSKRSRTHSVAQRRCSMAGRQPRLCHRKGKRTKFPQAEQKRWTA